MGFFSEIDIEIREMIADGASWKQVRAAFPMLRDDEIDAYFGDDQDESDEDDGQPSEYTEWQDYMGGDDWDHGQYDEAF